MLEKDLNYLKSNKIFVSVSTSNNTFRGIIAAYDDYALLLKECTNIKVNDLIKESGVKTLVILKSVDAIAWEYSKDLDDVHIANS
jgi:sRNA-binding regulator protein Hfq